MVMMMKVVSWWLPKSYELKEFHALNTSHHHSGTEFISIYFWSIHIGQKLATPLH
jgi:hypothetical protein